MNKIEEFKKRIINLVNNSDVLFVSESAKNKMADMVAKMKGDEEECGE